MRKYRKEQGRKARIAIARQEKKSCPHLHKKNMHPTQLFKRGFEKSSLLNRKKSQHFQMYFMLSDYKDWV